MITPGPTSSQVRGDCKTIFCDTAGGSEEKVDLGDFWCDAPSDCESGVCSDGACALPTCMDGVKNDGETGIDCSAPSCAAKCPDGQGCASHDDCVSGVCWGAVCQAPSCTDNVMNGDEVDVDCGGSNKCGPCPAPK